MLPTPFLAYGLPTEGSAGLRYLLYGLHAAEDNYPGRILGLLPRSYERQCLMALDKKDTYRLYGVRPRRSRGTPEFAVSHRLADEVY